MSDVTLTVLLVNWNGSDDTCACLVSLVENNFPQKLILVVDNGSTDASAARIAERFPNVRVISTDQNLGFTGGNNLGLAHVTTPFVMLLNNDTVVAPDAISRLMAAATADDLTGIWSPLICYFDAPDEPWFAGSKLDLASGTAVHDNSAIPTGPTSLPWLSGCCMLMRTELLKKLGGFDDRFYLNWEDVDLSLRVRDIGLDLRLLPSARVLHKVGRSISQAGTDGLYYAVRNNLLLLEKRGTGAGAKVRVIHAALRGIARIAWHRRPWLKQLAAVLEAIVDGSNHRYGPRPAKTLRDQL